MRIRSCRLFCFLFSFRPASFVPLACIRIRTHLMTTFQLRIDERLIMKLDSNAWSAHASKFASAFARWPARSPIETSAMRRLRWRFVVHSVFVFFLDATSSAWLNNNAPRLNSRHSQIHSIGETTENTSMRTSFLRWNIHLGHSEGEVQ